MSQLLLNPTDGVVGTFTTATYPYGNGVISLRFDDGNEDDHYFIYPLLVARNLKAGFSVIRNRINVAGSTSLTQILEMQSNGMEILCHSFSHGADPGNYDNFYHETAQAVSEMRTCGIKIDSFSEPGNWNPGYYWNLMLNTGQWGTSSFWETPGDELLNKCFFGWTGFIQNPDRNLPITGQFREGANHYTGDGMSLVDLEASVDWCIQNHKGREFGFHSGSYIGQPGYITKADFTSFLDYIQSKILAGTLTVLTPTQSLYATPR